MLVLKKSHFPSAMPHSSTHREVHEVLRREDQDEYTPRKAEWYKFTHFISVLFPKIAIMLNINWFALKHWKSWRGREFDCEFVCFGTWRVTLSDGLEVKPHFRRVIDGRRKSKKAKHNNVYKALLPSKTIYSDIGGTAHLKSKRWYGWASSAWPDAGLMLAQRRKVAFIYLKIVFIWSYIA